MHISFQKKSVYFHYDDMYCFVFGLFCSLVWILVIVVIFCLLFVLSLNTQKRRHLKMTTIQTDRYRQFDRCLVYASLSLSLPWCIGCLYVWYRICVEKHVLHCAAYTLQRRIAIWRTCFQAITLNHLIWSLIENFGNTDIYIKLKSGLHLIKCGDWFFCATIRDNIDDIFIYF